MVPMRTDANRADDPDDVAALARHAAALLAAVDAAVPAWIERIVAERWRAWTEEDPPASVLSAARSAGARARSEAVPALRDLLGTDVDAQRTNPLALLRRASAHATAVLAEAGVPPVRRDADAMRLFPDDPYDLVPGSFADLDASVHEPGIVWGAAKAHVILRRRRSPPATSSER
jgi:hypothetical protein